MDKRLWDQGRSAPDGICFGKSGLDGFISGEKCSCFCTWDTIFIPQGLTELTWWYCDEDHTSDSLVETTEEQLPVDCSLGCIVVDLLVVWTLKSCLQGVQGIDEEINGEGCEGSRLWSSVSKGSTFEVKVNTTTVQKHKSENENQSPSQVSPSIPSRLFLTFSTVVRT